ncbi:1-phosphofructokinase family hexose kinase [Streptomyces sp. NPDC004111]|uniref:1-phosphofructokinase family hexose kinase n=1 Tax=Streptomyces sp. NPDC004111 TaxID=3364690 RepID=UPI0036C57A08
MILTVTLNTALDLTHHVPQLVPHTSHRVTAVTERPGGKGLNVARVLAALGHETVVTGFAGGPTGEVLRGLLAAEAAEAAEAARAAGRAGAARTDRTAGAGGAGTGATGSAGSTGSTAGTAATGAAEAGGAARVTMATGATGAISATAATSVTHATGNTGAAAGPDSPGIPPVRRLAPIDALVPISGNTRRTLAVVDGSTGDTTQLNEPGPTVSPAEWDAFLASYDRLLGGARAVALCGSLPPGIHVGAYADLIRRARTAGVPVLLDTSGEPLRRGIAARPDLIKPNLDELAQLTGSREPLTASADARRRGAHSVVASLGPDGILAATESGTWQAHPPAAIRGNPTGAGDSAVAALLAGLVEDLPWPQRLARAVALSAATVAAPTAGEFDAETYASLLPQVKVTEPTSAHGPV